MPANSRRVSSKKVSEQQSKGIMNTAALRPETFSHFLYKCYILHAKIRYSDSNPLNLPWRFNEFTSLDSTLNIEIDLILISFPFNVFKH
jgi:hypothetical protein